MASLIRLANERIPIAQACQWAGMDVSEGEGQRKLRCPFGDYAHSDSGAASSLRMYEDTNHVFCFACARWWSPVSLMAEFWDCTRPEAADHMCKLAGITPPDWREWWEELHRPLPSDIASLAEALKTWCARIYGPGWEIGQFEPELANPLAACLSVLSLVTTGQEGDTWLDSSKLVMLPWLKKEEMMINGGHGRHIAGASESNNDLTGSGHDGRQQAGGAQDGAQRPAECVADQVGWDRPAAGGAGG